MSSNTGDGPTDDALWWLSFERPEYPHAISSADILRGLQFRYYHSHWSKHHAGMRLFDSFVLTAQSDIFTDHTPPSLPYIYAPRSVIECYNHDAYSKVNYALTDLGLEPHSTEWGPMWDLSGFCTSIDIPLMRWDEPRPNHEGMLNITDLQPGTWIYFHTGIGKRLMKVMDEVTPRQPRTYNTAYGGLVVALYDDQIRKTSQRALEDLGILPYMNPHGERWGEHHCTLAAVR